MTRYGSDVRKSPEWRTAENLFQELHTWSVFSIVGASPMAGTSPEELDHQLAEILEICTRYFPVWFHRAESMMRFGKS
ncbi:MAG: hypothetical protein GY950_14440, partial [bacterium]|nr:hypothetical protein [bacterium]